MRFGFNNLRKVSGGFASFLGVFGGMSAALGLSSCSPGMFFGSNQDDGVANTRSYRRVNVACAGLDLASSNLDVPNFRKLLDCFNSNGALEPIVNLARRLKDPEIQPIVDVSNHYLINNRKLLYQLERTYYKLSDKKILDNTLVQFGHLLENEEFVSSGIALLKEGYFADRGPRGNSPDRNLLRAMEHLATRITYEKTADFADTALTLARSKAFYSLQSHFRGDSPAGRGLRDLTDQGLAFIQDSADPHHVETGLKLIESLVAGDLFRAVDEVTGTDEESLRGSIPRLSSVLRTVLSSNAQIMDGLTSLFHYVHTPIHCLKGAETVPDGAMYVMRELTTQTATVDAASFLKRKNILALMAMNPFCDVPPQLGDYYPTMFAFADTTAIEPATDLLKAFYRIEKTDENGKTSHPLAELLVSILADTGSNAQEFPGGPPENTVGIKRLLPALAELTDRHAWDDVLLLSTLPRIEDRASVQDTFSFLLETIPGTDTSIYEVLTDAVSRATPENLYNFVYSLRRFVNSEKPLLDPAMTALRQAFYVNDVHPVIDLAHDILADATSQDKLFNTLFLISEMPEFQASVRLVSDMSKDGQLKELLGSVLTLFHKFALQGQTPIHDTAEPAFVFKGRHNFSESDLSVFPIGDEPAVSNQSCRLLDPRVSLGDYTQPAFYPQLNHFMACTDADHEHGDFTDVIAYLQREQTERRHSFLEFNMDLVRALDMTREQLTYLGDAFIRSVDQLRFFHIMDAVPLFVSKAIHGDSDAFGVSGSVLRPLFQLFRPLMTDWVRPGIQRLEGFGASVLRRADFPVILRYVDVLLDRKPEPVATAPHQDYDWERIKRWIWNKECENISYNPSASEIEKYKALRTKQVTDDANEAITTWDLVNGRPRRSWDFQDFRDFLGELIVKFGDPDSGIRPHAAIDALLNVVRYFTLPEDKDQPNETQHYHRKELRKFLMDRSNDYQLLTYFYPGEDKPRVRLVNTMDRLELVLINADFWSPWPFVPGHVLPDFKNHRNFGMLFLGQIADAWGDEPESAWPQVIRDRYRGSRPPTLAEAVFKIHKTAHTFEQLVGFPDLPGCQQLPNPNDDSDVQYNETHDPHASTGGVPSWLPGFNIPLMRKYLFNIHQVLPVLNENLPVPGQPLGKGAPMANGMRVLRDLFFQLYYSTPDGYRRADFHNPEDGFKNNLSIIMKLVRVGLTREAVRGLRDLKENDPTVVDFFDTLIEGATSPKVHELLDPLLDAKPELFWNVMRQVFGVLDAGEGGVLDANHLKQIQGKAPDEIVRIRAEWVSESAHMKQLGYYTMAAAGPLKLVDPFLITAGPVLRSYSEWLAHNADKIENLLSSKKSSWLIRSLYEDQDDSAKGRLTSVLRDLLNDPQHGLDGVGALKAIDDDAGSKNALSLVSDRWDVVKSLPEYQEKHLDEVMRQVLDFLEEQGTPINGVVAATRLRNFLAERMEQGDLDQFMVLGRRNPDEFYRVLETASRYIENGELKDFFKMARRALSEPSR